MKKRGLLGLVAGTTLGWTAASFVFLSSSDDADDASDADAAVGGRDGEANRGQTGSETPAESPSQSEVTDRWADTPVDDETGTETNGGDEETATATETTPEPAATAESTPEPENLREKIDVHTNSAGVGDDPGDEVSINYVIRNEHEFAVDIAFEATLRLANGATQRTRRTARIDGGSLTSGEFVFDDHEQRATGWGFSLQSVSRASTQA
ncbi:hypothetical protein [Haloprofundus salinisoli]|uniref:hypothetical protein n=1 Tax=Haloprofundus salinisoli TaxID=2876193 RepID=UPI001CCA5053|nr:hypothetical protein [Haloprofundus salinisoli]